MPANEEVDGNMTLLQPVEMSPKAENGDKWSQISNTAVIKRKLQKVSAPKSRVSDKSFSSDFLFRRQTDFRFFQQK